MRLYKIIIYNDLCSRAWLINYLLSRNSLNIPRYDEIRHIWKLNYCNDASRCFAKNIKNM